MSKDKPLITILTVNYNTSDFVELMLYGFNRLTVSPYRVLICDNGSDEKNLLRLAMLCKKFENVHVIFRQQSQAGSVGHGEAMDLLVACVSTPYFMSMDADATPLKKNWDSYFFEKIDSKIKAIGTPSVKDSFKESDFPCVYAVLYETETYQKLECRFLPKEGEEASGKDTGYVIRKNYLSAGFDGYVLEDRNTRYYKEGPYRDILCAEYYFPEVSSDIFFCHFGRGASDGVAKYKNGFVIKLPLIGRMIKKYLGKCDRKKWIQRSYKIINDQT